MIHIMEDTLDDVVTYLLIEAKKNTQGRVGLNAIRTTVVRIFEAIYGDDWRNVPLGEVSVEDLLKRFTLAEGTKYTSRTLSVYCARLRRAFDLYNARNERLQDIKVTMNDFEQQMRKLRAQVDQAKKSFETAVTHYLFTEEAMEDYNIYTIPIDGGKPLAIAIPKEIARRDAEMIKKMTERACGLVESRGIKMT